MSGEDRFIKCPLFNHICEPNKCNLEEHDKQVIKDFLEFQTDIDGIPFPESMIDNMVNTYFDERQVDYSE